VHKHDNPRTLAGPFREQHNTHKKGDEVKKKKKKILHWVCSSLHLSFRAIIQALVGSMIS
jgi:hypothetical protein